MPELLLMKGQEQMKILLLQETKGKLVLIIESQKMRLKFSLVSEVKYMNYEL